MTDAELLAKVKTGLGVTGTYLDETLQNYVFEVKQFLLDAGVDENVLNDSVSVGVITRGVLDLWSYGSGKLSEYFYQRAKQLTYKKISTPEPIPTLGHLTVTSEPGSEIFTTKITVSGASENPIFRYKITPDEIDLPTYHEDVSSYKLWNGTSDIEAEEGYIITLVETNSEGLAEKAGRAQITIFLE